MCGYANIIHAEAEPPAPLPEQHHSLHLNPPSQQLNIDPNADADDVINELFLAYQPPTTPASQHTIDSIPQVQVSPDILEGQPQCPVCMEPFLETTAQLPCQHCFHTECINTWLHSQNTCPVCRHELVEAPAAEPEAHRVEENIPAEWTCGSCTFSNTPDSVRCAMCGNEASVASAGLNNQFFFISFCFPPPPPYLPPPPQFIPPLSPPPPPLLPFSLPNIHL
jgi:hypothetical protein